MVARLTPRVAAIVVADSPLRASAALERLSRRRAPWADRWIAHAPDERPRAAARRSRPSSSQVRPVRPALRPPCARSHSRCRCPRAATAARCRARPDRGWSSSPRLRCDPNGRYRRPRWRRLPCVVNQRGKTGTLLTRGHSRQLVAVDAGSIDTRSGQRIDLLIQRLVPSADAGVAELGSGRGGSGVDCHVRIVSKVA